MVCRLYRLACLNWGPRWQERRLTLSAAAFLRAKDGKPFWRNRIDGLWLLFGGQHQHCQASFQRARRAPTDAKKGPRK
jgi:predicted NUDIX family NTP pyrophosphohydrolase